MTRQAISVTPYHADVQWLIETFDHADPCVDVAEAGGGGAAFQQLCAAPRASYNKARHVIRCRSTQEIRVYTVVGDVWWRTRTIGRAMSSTFEDNLSLATLSLTVDS